MAIIKCPDCGNDISEKAVACPKCGFSLDTQSSVDQTGLEWYMWLVLLCTGWIISLVYYFIQKDKAPTKAKQALACMVINLTFWIIYYL